MVCYVCMSVCVREKDLFCAVSSYYGSIVRHQRPTVLTYRSGDARHFSYSWYLYF